MAQKIITERTCSSNLRSALLALLLCTCHFSQGLLAAGQRMCMSTGPLPKGTDSRHTLCVSRSSSSWVR